MENEKAKQVIEICREAYARLEDAKSDCQDVVESAIEVLCGIADETPMKSRKGIQLERKDEIRSIKKIAKALATGKLQNVAAESNSIAEMVDSLNLSVE